MVQNQVESVSREGQKYNSLITSQTCCLGITLRNITKNSEINIVNEVNIGSNVLLGEINTNFMTYYNEYSKLSQILLL